MNQMINRLFFSFWILITFLWIPFKCYGSDQQPTDLQSLKAFLSMPLEENEVGFMFLGIFSNVIVRVSDKTILFDPSGLSPDKLDVFNSKTVDLILYTHAHSDHFAKPTALQLFKGSQPYIAIDSSIHWELKNDIPSDKLISTVSGQSYSAGNITIDTLEGLHEGPNMLFRITINGIKIFHGGDSAHVPLLQTMASHLAFVPTICMTSPCKPETAFQMISDIRPQIAVPMHGMNSVDIYHKEFKKLVDEKIPDTKVIIPKPYDFQKVYIYLPKE